MTDLRGPIRKITEVDASPSGTTLTYDCGHKGQANQIYHYKVGADSRCFICGQIARQQELTEEIASLEKELMVIGKGDWRADYLPKWIEAKKQELAHLVRA
jgi:hypothetical protein